MALSEYERTKRKREKYKIDGKCIDCGKILGDRPCRCEICSKKNNARWTVSRKKVVGRCQRCRRPLPGHRAKEKTCGWCLQDSRQRRW